MSEKVTITPDGLVVSRWNAETQENDKELIEENDPTVLSHLRTWCEIDPDTTIWHIMDFVRKSEVLSMFISQYAWCNGIDEFHEELDKPAIIDENDGMDHFEIRWDVDYHKSTKFTSFGLSPSFIGVGLPITEEKQKEKRSEDDPRGELPIGFVETYSVSASPLNTFAHLKLELNTTVDVYRLKRHPKTENIKILASECAFSLLDVLDAIYFEISFHGPPDQRDEFLDNMRGLAEEAREELHEGKGKLIEEIFDDLGVPPRTEEDDIADDNMDADEWEIDE